jgi:hypothetical protein
VIFVNKYFALSLTKIGKPLGTSKTKGLKKIFQIGLGYFALGEIILVLII